jgi:hypothetical protein
VGIRLSGPAVSLTALTAIYSAASDKASRVSSCIIR